VLLLVLACAPEPCRALEPDQLALVVNSNVPASRELAEFYAQKRGVPAGRVVAVDLPFPEEEMQSSAYGEKVVPAVRAFLRDNGLKDKVTCLVTFWGVPLRIARRPAGPADDAQVALVQREIERVRPELQGAVAQAEALARDLAPSFAPAAQGGDVAQLSRRAGEALTAVLRTAAAMPAGPRRDQAVEKLVTLLDELLGEADTAQRFASPELAPLAPARATREQAARLKEQSAEWMAQFRTLQAEPPTGQSADAMRAIIRDHFGLFRYHELLTSQYATFESKETESALDSELALLWWDNHYPRYRWQPNTLSYRARSAPAGAPPTLMVMRLDGPTEQSVDRMILSSIKVERLGLKGGAVLDGRGLKPDEGYGRYDQSIRSLASLIKEKTQLELTYDDRDPLMQPGPAAPKNVALYCGWYSLRRYAPAFTFSEGAVGFHVASGELVSLRTPGEKGWVHGLISDGVVGTLGPVAEPYLQSFPPADDFFPLLMTGELTLAEVYWKTTPFTSWMNACIGDPLYRPYRVNPPLKRTDLPERLRAALR
jgi:uncharacterized protein (TIGR03790 family)